MGRECMKARSQCRRTRCRWSGVTLIELLVAVAVLMIILAFSIPAFTGLIASTRIISATNAVLGHLQYARSEAVKGGVNVIVGPYNADGTWRTADRLWQGGYMVASGTATPRVLRRVDATLLQTLTIKNSAIWIVSIPAIARNCAFFILLLSKHR
jgi:Tfp pilus assembly protein FimT